ncbi:flagellar motor protein MotB [Collimonas silvisoli]|uniref:flagellar motor protein MotB n=1 Tax=Collimonas silvisoli TaxID=2825884 RepID=UPI001B8CF529|nr:flagellar motor protein MotB [Collimonas silvisoli]
MSKTNKQRIVVKRVTAAKHQAHGGSWKIAYADFMTAMMAFFLVMWLLSISSPKQKEGIAEYFNMPLRAAISGGAKTSTSSSVIPGGGTDFTQVDGEDKRSNPDAADSERLRSLKRRLEQVIDANPVLKQFRPQLLIDITSQGLRIQIVDNRNRPMFDLSSAKVQPYMSAILREIGPVLNELPNKITLAGHTDATPYVLASKYYSNWELSADRANASRRELIGGGMTEQKVLRVIGVASTMDLNKEDPLDPVNRRISIVVLNRRAQAQIEQENASGSNAGIKLDAQKDSASQLRKEAPKPPANAATHSEKP